MQNVVCWGHLVGLAPQVAFPMLLSDHSGAEQPLGQAGHRVVALMGQPEQEHPGERDTCCCVAAACWHGVVGETLRFRKLPRMDEPQAKADASTSSSLGEGCVFSLPPAILLLTLLHPQPVLPHTENIFILPFGFTSGCWGSKGGWYFVFNSSRNSVLIDTCQVWAVKAATFWAECRNVCGGKNRAGWFWFKNKIKVLLKFTRGPRNKHDKLQPRR